MLPIRLSPSVTDPEEWRLRCELTDFYHLVDFLGWTEMIFNHISVRLPGAAHHYLVNPFGLNYMEITPENLLKVGVDGRLVEPSGRLCFARRNSRDTLGRCLRGAYAHHGGVGSRHETRRF
jgi:ribulose-5-phosphate 4-epimerase/fuculose-1-phosphate aldolase